MGKRSVTLKGVPLRNPVAVEVRYVAALEKAVTKMTKDVKKQLVDLFNEPFAVEYFATDEEIQFAFDSASEEIQEAFAMDASVASQARLLLNRLTKKYDKIFAELAAIESRRMVAQANKSSEVAMNASLKKLSGGLTIKSASMNADLKETLKSSVSANVDLIKSIEKQYLEQVKSATYRSIANGNGLADLKPYLEKEQGVTQRRAKNIALDQTRKVYSDLNADRMRAAGTERYEWVHSGGGHKPRDHHITPFEQGGLNGGIFSLNDPPIIDPKTGQRGKPGDAINCKCTMVPVLEFEDGTRV